MCLTTGLPEDGHSLAPKYTRFRVRKCFQKLFENCCRLSFLIGQRLFPEVILCLKSFFKVRHGLGVDFLIETDNFLNIFTEIFRTCSKYFQKRFLVTKRVAVGAVELYRGGFCRTFQASADFEVKSAVASYFSGFYFFCGPNFRRLSLLFLGAPYQL